MKGEGGERNRHTKVYRGYTERQRERQIDKGIWGIYRKRMRDMRERGIGRESSKERGTRGHKNKETEGDRGLNSGFKGGRKRAMFKRYQR